MNRERPEKGGSGQTFDIKGSVMVIGGLDPTGGAGVVADIETLFSFRVKSSVVVTALTVQNRWGVSDLLPVPPHMVRQSFVKVIEEVAPDQIKTGIAGSADNLLLLPELFSLWRGRGGKGYVVMDPVLSSSSGYPFLDQDGITLFKERVIQEVDLLTPNIPEAQILTGVEIGGGEEMERAGRELLRMGARNVLIKGGHLQEGFSDLLVSKERVVEIEGSRLKGRGIRGSGCRFASAVTALLSRGADLELACRTAKLYIERLKGIQERAGLTDS